MNNTAISQLSLSQEELEALILNGGGMSQKAFDLYLKQKKNDKDFLQKLVFLARETKNIKTANRIVDFIRDADWQINYGSLVNKELAGIASEIKDERSLNIIKAIIIRIEKNPQIEDKDILIKIINDEKSTFNDNSKEVIQKAFDGLVFLFSLKKKYTSPVLVDFWKIHEHCKSTMLSLSAFTFCVKHNLFDNINFSDYQALFNTYGKKS